MSRKNVPEQQNLDEEQFYDNLDELRDLIEDPNDNNDAPISSSDQGASDEQDVIDDELANLGDTQDYSSEVGDKDYRVDDNLLAEFSDYGEFSDDEYDEQDFMDAIREANNFKVKRKNKAKRKNNGASTQGRPRKERSLDPEVAQLLSEANEAFVRNDTQVAEQLYNEVIRKDVKNFAAYKTLGDIYQLQGRFNDCCNSWFLAAHLNPSDWEFWKVVATLSSDLGHVRQAIYCYTRALRMNNEEWDCVYGRAVLYKKTGQLGRALEGFQRLYNNTPTDGNLLRELAVLYVDYNRINEAIGLYMKIFDANVEKRKAIICASEDAVESSEDSDENLTDNVNYEADEESEDFRKYPNIKWKKINKKYRCLTFDWSSLNILAELFLKQSGENAGIKTIKKCARWIQRRENQTFWENISDDSEFDERRLKNSRYESLTQDEKNKSYILPIDIRVRLGLLRLNNKQVLEAMNHFQALYDESFADITDLFFEVACALAKAEKYSEAIEFFTPLLQLSDFSTLEFYKPLSRCYKEVEDYPNAKIVFEKLVELKPDDLETKLTLAEIHYHLDDQETFNALLLEVLEARKQQDADAQKILSSVDDKPFEEAVDSVATDFGKPLLEDIHIKKASVKRKRTPQDAERERRDREKRITSKVLDKYNKLKIYNEGMENGQEYQTTLWIDTASDLIDVFSSVKNFFVKSRSKKFVGIIKRTRKFNKIIDYKIKRLSKLSEGDNLLDGLPLLEERVFLTSATELRGLTYEQWFELFMELSLVITKLQSVEDGLSIIETAQEVNVFIQDPQRVKMMKFIKLAIVLQMEDEEELVESLRGVLNQFQFNRKVLQNFMFCVVRGQMASDILSSTVQQKFFLRQLKAYDSIRYNQHVAGQASVTNKKVDNPDKLKSPYLHYIYAMLLYSSKGFLLALQYLSRLQPELPQDPMINFMMGLAHLHRSMQRLTASRHLQVLHGLRFLYQYHDIRSTKYTILEKQEADYNIGRAFHLLGLFSTAVRYYQQVLDNYEDEKLKKHAAYNCILIFNESGNTELANSLMEKYLSI
ncbi:LANO_0G02344g1_1 [Lachancea nothofagi CBS 11611]|uniref:LANO_0G02344g1_1 n=1 Tax=Lachancea nothofagi CBS 11611 TaxID=1266666 RepID=A0A1G4KF92_9SACH|nr:LANO_0G02344g1_1 [Lachancea nothofagi CBS 11611]